MNLLKNVSFKHKIMRKTFLFMFIYRKERWLCYYEHYRRTAVKKLTSHITSHWARVTGDQGKTWEKEIKACMKVGLDKGLCDINGQIMQINDRRKTMKKFPNKKNLVLPIKQ